MHSASYVSDWLLRWQHLLPAQARVLDVACGSGRHARHLAQLGHVVTGVDRDAQALAALADCAQVIVADIENGPWPLAGQTFDLVLVTNYLWRPLWPQILASVAPGGLLIYETFAQGNAAYGRPARPEFLLMPGELLQVCSGWYTIAFEQGVLAQPTRVVQRIAARSPQVQPLPVPLQGPL